MTVIQILSAFPKSICLPHKTEISAISPFTVFHSWLAPHSYSCQLHPQSVYLFKCDFTIQFKNLIIQKIYINNIKNILLFFLKLLYTSLNITKII